MPARMKTRITKTIIKTSLGCEDILVDIVVHASASVTIRKTKNKSIIVRTNHMKMVKAKKTSHTKIRTQSNAQCHTEQRTEPHTAPFTQSYTVPHTEPHSATRTVPRKQAQVYGIRCTRSSRQRLRLSCEDKR